MFFWRKDHIVTRMIEEYLIQAEACLAEWAAAFEIHAEFGVCTEFDERVDKTHVAESLCDDLRRGMEASLYEKSLVPESRGDLVFLLEALDQIPSEADEAIHELQAEQLTMPRHLAAKHLELVHLNRECFEDLAAATRALFRDLSKVAALVHVIDKKESVTDHLQHDLIRAVFADPEIAPAQRILLKEMVVRTNRVSDLSEHAGDRLMMLTVKRMV